MRYATLTLNPCVDQTMFFSVPFEAGKLNRAESGITNCGGKGLNVSRVLRTLGVSATAFGFSGGDTGTVLERKVKEEQIDYSFIPTEAETRLNLKLIDSGGVCTECNEAGGPVTKEELERLLRKTDQYFRTDPDDCCFFMGGSVPRGIGKNVYEDLITFYKDRGVRFILDADGEALTRGLSAGPWMIKPNLYELSGLMGFEIDSVGVAVSACRTVADTFGTNVLCTLGENGALYTSKDGVWQCTAPKVPVRGFSGAGDTFLASFVYLLTNGGTVEESLTFGSAMASAKVATPGNGIPSVQDAQKLVSAVTVCKIA